MSWGVCKQLSMHDGRAVLFTVAEILVKYYDNHTNSVRPSSGL